MLQETEINPLLMDAPALLSESESQPVPQEINSPYQKRLKGWAIVRIDEAETHIVSRFRSHSDADGHLKFVRQKFPNNKFAVVFEK